MDVAQMVDRVRRHYDDGCFACGRDNPIGLHLDDFAFENGVVTARFTPRPHFRGVEGVLHGGVAATALDEISVWAGILSERVISVTGTLDLRFKSPLGVSEEIVATGQVIERNGRRLIASADLSVGGRVAAKSKGVFLVSGDLSHIV